jgi:hypothetical protein
LKDGFSGKILLPDEDGYDNARKIWNGMIDKHRDHRALRHTTDIVRAVNFARDPGSALAARSQHAGSAICDDGW